MKVVYLLLNKDTNYIKVGVTKDIDKRKRKLELESGSTLTLIYVTDLLNRYLIIESSFKSHFRLYKQQGEWFNIDIDSAIHILQFIIQNLERNPLML